MKKREKEKMNKWTSEIVKKRKSEKEKKEKKWKKEKVKKIREKDKKW